VRGAVNDKRLIDESVGIASVGIQELREAERAFHQDRDVQQRRIYAVATRRITTLPTHRTTGRNRERHQRSPSKTR